MRPWRLEGRRHVVPGRRFAELASTRHVLVLEVRQIEARRTSLSLGLGAPGGLVGGGPVCIGAGSAGVDPRTLTTVAHVGPSTTLQGASTASLDEMPPLARHGGPGMQRSVRNGVCLSAQRL